MSIVFLQPQIDVEVVELLAPEHPGQRLAHDGGGVGADPRRREGGVELVGLLAAEPEHLVEGRAETLARRDGEIGALKSQGHPS